MNGQLLVFTWGSFGLNSSNMHTDISNVERRRFFIYLFFGDLFNNDKCEDEYVWSHIA